MDGSMAATAGSSSMSLLTHGINGQVRERERERERERKRERIFSVAKNTLKPDNFHTESL